MTVSELRASLAEYPQDVLVVVQENDGNTYSPLSGTSLSGYRAETTWSGEVGPLELTAADRAAGYEEDDVLVGGVVALILEPVH